MTCRSRSVSRSSSAVSECGCRSDIPSPEEEGRVDPRLLNRLRNLWQTATGFYVADRDANERIVGAGFSRPKVRLKADPTSVFDELFDVAVVGGGNAGLCAALTASD